MAINLNKWRDFIMLYYYDNWLSFLSKVYNVPILNREEPFLFYGGETTTTEHSDKMIIHESNHRKNPVFNWKKIINSNQCIFVTCNIDEYHNFEYKDHVQCHVAKNLSEIVSIINTSKGFCGNQSAYLAIAFALGKKCIVNYSQNEFDRNKYIGLSSNII